MKRYLLVTQTKEQCIHCRKGMIFRFILEGYLVEVCPKCRVVSIDKILKEDKDEKASLIKPHGR